MNGYFVVSIIAMIFQILSWIGGARRAAMIPMGGVYGAGYALGSNIGLIIAIIFLILGIRKLNKSR